MLQAADERSSRLACAHRCSLVLLRLSNATYTPVPPTFTRRHTPAALTKGSMSKILSASSSDKECYSARVADPLLSTVSSETPCGPPNPTFAAAFVRVVTNEGKRRQERVCIPSRWSPSRPLRPVRPSGYVFAVRDLFALCKYQRKTGAFKHVCNNADSLRVTSTAAREVVHVARCFPVRLSDRSSYFHNKLKTFANAFLGGGSPGLHRYDNPADPTVEGTVATSWRRCLHVSGQSSNRHWYCSKRWRRCCHMMDGKYFRPYRVRT